MKKTIIALGFDTEEIYMPDEYDFDGIITLLADVMDGEGFKCSFCLTGDKLRRLIAKKRQDVIKSLTRHQVESHTDTGSRHPNVLEYLENKKWAPGVSEVQKRETPCFSLIKETFGKESFAMNAHNNTNGAQLIYALSLMKKGIRLGGSQLHSFLGNNKAAGWYCNTVVIGGRKVSAPGFFRKEWDNDFLKLQAIFENYKLEGMDIIAGNVFHEMEMKSAIMTDRFGAANGLDLSVEKFGKWGIPPLRTEKEFKISLNNLLKYCHFIQSQDWLENLSLSEIVKRYSWQPLFIRSADIETAVINSLDSHAPYIGGFFSPAEILAAECEAIASYDISGTIPEKIKRRNVLGPLAAPNMFPQAIEVTSKAAREMAKKILAHINTHGCLPHNIKINGLIFGIGSAFHAVSELWLSMFRKKQIDRIILVKPGISLDEKFMRWLPWGGLKYETWPDNILTKPGLNTHYAFLYTRLQSWTLKPAYLKNELENAGLEVGKPFII